MNRPTLRYIILAAGAATRFGRNKLLAEFGSTCMLDRALRLAPSENQTLVVTGAYRRELESHLNNRKFVGQTVHNEQWQCGMGKSIAIGVSEIPETDGVMILLGDQVKLEPHHINRLRNHWYKDPGQLVCASYANTLGVPAIFPNRLFELLQTLDGEQGAKAIIERDHHRLAVPLQTASWDIDTPNQLQSYLSDYLKAAKDIRTEK